MERNKRQADEAVQGIVNKKKNGIGQLVDVSTKAGTI